MTEYVSIFKDEFEKISTEELREFVVEAVATVEDGYYSDKDIEYIKRVVKISERLCDALDVDDYIYDMLTVSGLIHIMCKYENGEVDPYHMLKVRLYLSELLGVIGRDQYNDIMLVIESQSGHNSPIPQVAPKIDDTVYSWIFPFAVHLAKDDSYEL